MSKRITALTEVKYIFGIILLITTATYSQDSNSDVEFYWCDFGTASSVFPEDVSIQARAIGRTGGADGSGQQYFHLSAFFSSGLMLSAGLFIPYGSPENSGFRLHGLRNLFEAEGLKVSGMITLLTYTSKRGPVLSSEPDSRGRSSETLLSFGVVGSHLLSSETKLDIQPQFHVYDRRNASYGVFEVNAAVTQNIPYVPMFARVNAGYISREIRWAPRSSTAGVDIGLGLDLRYFTTMFALRFIGETGRIFDDNPVFLELTLQY